LALRILAFWFFIATTFCSFSTVAGPDDYVIGAGDALTIKVYNELDLAVRAKVPQSGVLRIPLLGDINVVDKTIDQLSLELENAYLDGYLVNPSVSVVVDSFRPFYIRGAVKKSGVYQFEFDLTVDQAVAIAGGLEDRASNTAWFVIRGAQKKRVKVSKESRVYPGDIIEIQESLF
jgi:protein involved in polysaccharide export with SLBB domain